MVMLDNWELFKISMIPISCIGGFCAFVIYLFSRRDKKEEERDREEQIRHNENRKNFEDLGRKIESNDLKFDLRMEKFEKNLLESDMRKDAQIESIVQNFTKAIKSTKAEQDNKITSIQNELDLIVKKQVKHDEDISLFKKVLEEIKSKVNQIFNIKIAQTNSHDTGNPMEGHRLWTKGDKPDG